MTLEQLGLLYLFSTPLSACITLTIYLVYFSPNDFPDIPSNDYNIWDLALVYIRVFSLFLGNSKGAYVYKGASLSPEHVRLVTSVADKCNGSPLSC